MKFPPEEFFKNSLMHADCSMALWEFEKVENMLVYGQPSVRQWLEIAFGQDILAQKFSPGLQVSERNESMEMMTDSVLHTNDQRGKLIFIDRLSYEPWKILPWMTKSQRGDTQRRRIDA